MFFSRGYADGEIEALFAKYDMDGDRVLDESEQKKLQADLNKEQVTCLVLMLSLQNIINKIIWQGFLSDLVVNYF